MLKICNLIKGRTLSRTLHSLLKDDIFLMMFCSFQIQSLHDSLNYLTPACRKYVLYYCALKDTVTFFFFAIFCSFVIILNFYHNLKLVLCFKGALRGANRVNELLCSEENVILE